MQELHSKATFDVALRQFNYISNFETTETTEDSEDTEKEDSDFLVAVSEGCRLFRPPFEEPLLISSSTFSKRPFRNHSAIQPHFPFPCIPFVPW